jgi:hypothetical protein
VKRELVICHPVTSLSVLGPCSLPAVQHHAEAIYTVAEGGPVDLLATLFENVLQVRLDWVQFHRFLCAVV